jgi:crotonobetainyl-CoA:carnitine CoA-transferase CaiB-like acyl-CoA transferase
VSGALSDVRVLDLSRLLPGGFCSLLMADLGAEVLKVEDTGMGDYIRWAEPRYEGAERSAASALFLALNRGKRSARVNLKSGEGQEVLKRLAREHDVLLESFRPGVLDRLGVGYDVLREENPGLVFCAITGYGQDGPYRDRPGHDMNYLGLNGVLGLTGEKGGPPVQAAGQIADLGGGALMAAFAILAASATARGRGSSWTSPCTTGRCPGWRWSPAASCATARRPAGAASSWPARWSATGPTRARTAGSPSARWSRSSGRRGVAAWAGRT